MNPDLDTLIRELGDAATRLRSGEIDALEAAVQVERCAELAGQLGTELDRAAREAGREERGEGKEQLL